MSHAAENAALDEDRAVDFVGTGITESTRGAYPIEFILGAQMPLPCALR